MARMTEELAAFARIAMAAGKVILDLRDGINTYQSKVDGSPVTAADVAAEDTVLDGLTITGESLDEILSRVGPHILRRVPMS